MGSWFDRAARTFGRTVEVHPGGAEAGVTVRAFLQPIRDRAERQFLPAAPGTVRQDRFLYLGPAKAALSGGDGSWLSCGKVRYEVETAQAVYVGERVSYWWAVLRPGEEEP